jgi:hypothetical protein
MEVVMEVLPLRIEVEVEVEVPILPLLQES